jgi:hypothetical protein
MLFRIIDTIDLSGTFGTGVTIAAHARPSIASIAKAVGVPRSMSMATGLAYFPGERNTPNESNVTEESIAPIESIVPNMLDRRRKDNKISLDRCVKARCNLRALEQ